MQYTVLLHIHLYLLNVILYLHAYITVVHRFIVDWNYLARTGNKYSANIYANYCK